MTQLAGFPYTEARFDGRAQLAQEPVLPPGTQDVFVISHGWRNAYDEAHQLYTGFFTHFAATGSWPAARRAAIVAVYWPSANFDFLLAAQPSMDSGGAAGAGESTADTASRQKLHDLLERLKRSPLAEGAQAQAALSEAQALIPDLERKATARAAFLQALRRLMGADPAPREDASDAFRADPPESVFRNLAIPVDLLDPDVPRPGTPGGQAVGVLDFFKGIAAGAANAVSYLTYYKMKERAGLIGETGLAPLLDRLGASAERLHLVGHSFGARLVSAAALRSQTPKLRTLALLQAAFSHHGFSARKQGYFRQVVAGRRIAGATVVTHTRNDQAVGVAYPLASRLSGANAAALGDRHDPFGGLGRNGAQQMDEGESVDLADGAAAAARALKPGRLHNVLADGFIRSHGDVDNAAVAGLVRAAIDLGA